MLTTSGEVKRAPNAADEQSGKFRRSDWATEIITLPLGTALPLPKSPIRPMMIH